MRKDNELFKEENLEQTKKLFEVPAQFKDGITIVRMPVPSGWGKSKEQKRLDRLYTAFMSLGVILIGANLAWLLFSIKG